MTSEEEKVGTTASSEEKVCTSRRVYWEGNPPASERVSLFGGSHSGGNMFAVSIFIVLKGENYSKKFPGGFRLLEVRYAGILWFKLRVSPEGGRPETLNDGWPSAMRRQRSLDFRL